MLAGWVMLHVAGVACPYLGYQCLCPTWLAELQINLFAMRLDAANLWFIWFWSTKQKVGHAYAAAETETERLRTKSREDFSSILHLPLANLCDPLAKRKVKTWLWLWRLALIDIWDIRCGRSRKLIKFANYWSHTTMPKVRIFFIIFFLQFWNGEFGMPNELESANFCTSRY